VGCAGIGRDPQTGRMQPKGYRTGLTSGGRRSVRTGVGGLDQSFGGRIKGQKRSGEKDR